MANAGAKKKSAGTIALIAVVVLFGGVCIIGILAAIAIPAFIGYMQRAKTAEARANVRTIYTGMTAYADAESALPPSLGRSPAAVSCGQKQLWPMDAPTTWSELGFSPADPLYYSYSVEVRPNGRDFVIVAEGDLDCDGILSRFELRGQYDPATGALSREGDIVAVDELE